MSEPIAQLSADEAREWHAVVREQIRHENELVHQRLTWLIQLQGLLFAALAFAWGKGEALVCLISFLGVGTAVSLWSALRHYGPAVRQLAQWWSVRRPDDFAGPDVIGLWAPSDRLARWLRPWRFLPWVFVAAWVFVLAYSAVHASFPPWPSPAAPHSGSG
jgi:hypothetical protein